jgi:hypothetical protein
MYLSAELTPDLQITYQQIATPFPVTYRDIVALRVRKRDPEVLLTEIESETNPERSYFIFGVAINHR